MKTKNIFLIAFLLLAVFAVWTLAVCFFDVRAVGPNGSAIGFSSINSSFHSLTGVNMVLYHITDYLSIMPICVMSGFALLGLYQWIKRKHFKKIDFNLLILSGFYIVLIALYILFEIFAVNYRPVLIEGILEASYPSSTTLLILFVMPTAFMQFNIRIKRKFANRCITVLIIAYTAFMVISRLLSGVHWLSDIIGGILLSAGLAAMYYAFCRLSV